MALLGEGSVALALGLYVYAALAGAWGAARGSKRLQRSARNALLAAFPATAVSAGALIAAFLRQDFSLVYVAQHSSLSLPLAYRVSAGRADDDARERHDARVSLELARAQGRRRVPGDARVQQEDGQQPCDGERDHQTNVTLRCHSHPPFAFRLRCFSPTRR